MELHERVRHIYRWLVSRLEFMRGLILECISLISRGRLGGGMLSTECHSNVA